MEASPLKLRANRPLPICSVIDQPEHSPDFQYHSCTFDELELLDILGGSQDQALLFQLSDAIRWVTNYRKLQVTCYVDWKKTLLILLISLLWNRRTKYFRIFQLFSFDHFRKMFIGGLSWQTSPGECEEDILWENLRTNRIHSIHLFDQTLRLKWRRR